MSLIAIVGSDGAGKSTVVAAVRREIAKRWSVSLVDKWDILDTPRFPEYRFVGADLKTLRTCVAEMRDVNRTLFLFWALHGTLTPERMRQTEVVLLDGYWPKHAAAEIAYTAPPELVEALIAIMPVPQLTILLDVDPQTAYARRANDEAVGLIPYECGQQDCSLAGFMSHQRKIRETLLQWAGHYGWHVVNADRSLEQVVAEVVGAVSTRVPDQVQ